MATAVIMPKFSMTQESGTVVQWHKVEGDVVVKGEPILEVETDKVVMEVESPASGVLRGISAMPGEVIPVTETIAYILEPDEPWSPPTSKEGVESVGPKTDQETVDPAATDGESLACDVSPIARRVAKMHAINLAEVAGSGPGGRIIRSDVEALIAKGGELPKNIHDKVRATPAARRLAREYGVELGLVTGSGPRGRIQSLDVNAVGTHSTVFEKEARVIPLEGTRRSIAQRMAHSFSTVPHFALQINVDMTRAEEMRQAFNEVGIAKITTTVQIVKASAWALSRNPYVNARLEDEGILLIPDINIGVAIALKEGLIVPVVRNADRRSITEIAEEVSVFSQRAREGRLTLEDVTGGTFTVTNLGMFGIDRFTAIINPPESAILAVGRITRCVVPSGSGDEIDVRPILTLTLSVDHRVLDGAMAARFLEDLRRALEEPGWLSY